VGVDWIHVAQSSFHRLGCVNVDGNKEPENVLIPVIIVEVLRAILCAACGYGRSEFYGVP
jgi:hypothetical protein